MNGTEDIGSNTGKMWRDASGDSYTAGPESKGIAGQDDRASCREVSRRENEADR